MTIDNEKTDETRAEMRRLQVLEAASSCFRIAGFHNASMAQIAKTAGMSVGHIYHYFENKEAIIAAIVARDEAAFLARMESLRHEPNVFQALIDKADAGLDRSMNTSEAALLLEILAEASHQPKIAELVHQSDQARREEMRKIIALASKSSDAYPKKVLGAQVELLSAVFEGLRIRAIRNPDIDRAAVLALLRPVIQRILEG